MNTQLTKTSGPDELRNYFNKILELHKTGEKFPTNINEVWPLIYSTKAKALSILKDNFIEGEDFELYRMGKVVSVNELKNGVATDVKLSVSCVEYFIARKVRPVFEVYRQVFHQAANNQSYLPTKPGSALEMLKLMITAVEEQSQDIQEIKNEVLELKSKSTTSPDYFTIAGYGAKTKHPVDLKTATILGKKAVTICNRMGYIMGETPDPRFGRVRTYPTEVLKLVFDDYFKSTAA